MPAVDQTYDAWMAKPSFDDDLEALESLREPTRLRLYRLIERSPAPVGREEAAGAIGISRSLAAFHLDQLVGVGLLSVEYRRLTGRTGPGAGRTSKLYRRSRHTVQLSLPHRDHELLARALAQTYGSRLTEIADVEPAREAGQALGARARRSMRGRVTDERLIGCTQDVLESLGFDPYRTSPTEIRLRNCPFAPLSRLFTPLVCGVAMSLMDGLGESVAGGRFEVSREYQRDRCCPIIRVRGDPEATRRTGQDLAV